MQRVILDLERLKLASGGLRQFCQHLGNALLRELPRYGIRASVLTHERARGLVQEPADFLCAAWWRKKSIRQFMPWAVSAPEESADLWHVTHHQSKYWPEDPHTPVLLTIHDLKFLHISDGEVIEKSLRRLQSVVDRATAIATVSEAARRDIEDNVQLGNRSIHVIHNGVYAPGTIEGERPPRIGNRPFLFSIGVFERKKNFHALIDMMEHLPEWNLVLAGDWRTSYGRHVQALANTKAWRDRIQFTGLIDDAQRQWLYENCSAFVFPSIAEGFGLPVLEAMSAGRPVVLSRCTSLPEVGGDLATYWDEFSPRHMAATVRQSLADYVADPSLEQRLVARARRFSWDDTARKYAQLYVEVLAARTRTAGRRLAA
jgi:glycosyltransferase involved in cell wall biosynthesis